MTPMAALAALMLSDWGCAGASSFMPAERMLSGVAGAGGCAPSPVVAMLANYIQCGVVCASEGCWGRNDERVLVYQLLLWEIDGAAGASDRGTGERMGHNGVVEGKRGGAYSLHVAGFHVQRANSNLDSWRYRRWSLRPVAVGAGGGLAMIQYDSV
ncbi:hypothetical protein HBI56_091120 [Parastagonospora nodorum]|nr:hypothetical protein HBH42_159180 [Parastagonospora nodorum]KAH4222376.1 hypothetical protein HBI06_148660 [Parastagonospora nodorum]KAH4228499.1 hypothetical protein HBI05_206090 [Parastagonospora nodorum]KAH4266212.1 hypothetical protein HBI03_078690 [Parastagonospora nodorum]KAH4275769.1 hypothetical protein HBI04_125870 [Parastagonospora nodorum]